MPFFLFFLCIIILTIRNKANIIIPFKIKENLNFKLESNQEQSSFHNILFNTYISKIEIGTPSQIVEAQISSQKYGTVLNEGSCLTSEHFNKKYSSSIVEVGHCEDRNIYKLYKEISINETLTFPFYNKSSNIKTNYKIKDFSLLYFKDLPEQEKKLIKKYGRKMQLYDDLFGGFDTYKNKSYLENKKDGKACLLIGMKLHSSHGCLPKSNFVSYLSKTKNIQDSNWVIKFYDEKEKENEKNKYDGEFIIGSAPHEYSPENYKKDNFKIANALYYQHSPSWQTQFKDIYFLNEGIPNSKEVINNKIDVSINSNALFDFDIKVIFGTKTYYNLINENFFSKYKDKCQYIIDEKRYGIFQCDKEFDSTDKFPTLFFYHREYNYTFELNYKDLFEDMNDKKYFLVAFDEAEQDLWKFGTIFFKKYLFVFNSKEKTIGFYYNKNNNNANFSIKLSNNMLWIIFILLSGLGGFLLGKKIYLRYRGKRLNELNDNFVYKAKNDSEIALEMSSRK